MTKKPSTLSVIMKRELKAYFTSPVAYIVTCLFLIINGVLFFSLFFVQNRADLRAYFANLPLFLSFFVPALTMKIFAEERRSGSMETLMTLPVTEWDVVTGKYLASFFGTLLMIAPTLLYVITLVIFGSSNWWICWCCFFKRCLYCNRLFFIFNYKKSNHRFFHRPCNLSRTHFV